MKIGANVLIALIKRIIFHAHFTPSKDFFSLKSVSAFLRDLKCKHI